LWGWILIKYDEFSPVALTSELPSDQRDLRNDPEIWKWCRQYTLINQAEHAAWEESQQKDPTIKMYGIMDYEKYQQKTVSYMVGTGGLTSIDKHNQSAEFSLFIAPEHQREGYGRKALQTLITHGFRDHNLRRIWGESFEGNPAQKMFEKIGMELDGTLRKSYFLDGKFVDSHIWSILREDWVYGP
jgi:RimJ/RimL family protein N-acetyltransferase